MRAFMGTSLLAGVVAGQQAISASGTNFTLTADGMSYLFHVDTDSGELISDHFGGPVTDFTTPPWVSSQGWIDGLGTVRREYPDIGRGDFRLPAIHIQHADGNTVSEFAYQSHEIVPGKPTLPGLPATYGNDGDVTTLIVQLYDNYSDVSAALSYSVFPQYNAIARSFQITNNGSDPIIIQRAASFSTDLPNVELDLVELHGDWSHEANIVRRKVDYGETTFRSSFGYSSHQYNPFFALVDPSTTESTGEAWGFNFVYTGSFEATAERFSNGFVRVLLGLNPIHSSLTVRPGDTFTSPEAVAVYSSEGLGAMSRSFHSLYRNHLSRSNWTSQERPVLLNSWESEGFNYTADSLEVIAQETADLGIKLFVNDDGWFGVEYPRDNDTLGLGDWTPNPEKFPNGLNPYVEQVNAAEVNASAGGNHSGNLAFGIWVEPEMINPNSTLYREHPEWVLHSGSHPRTLTRNQLVLNVALPEVQEYIIDQMTTLFSSANISYVKWDNNRGIHEMPTPATSHEYLLGLYHIIDNLTTTFPDILFEGCASGGGRFDAGLLHYWPQHWTSDNTDAAARLTIQMGTSIAYPPSAMGCHVSAIPNGGTARNISIEYRAHVALMCGSFGFELNPDELTPQETEQIPSIMDLAARLQPLVINGDYYRLRLPENSNWPAFQFVSADGSQAALFAFQQFSTIKPAAPPYRLQGLDPTARYANDYDNATYSGATYMNGGLNVEFRNSDGDYQSEVIFLTRE